MEKIVITANEATKKQIMHLLKENRISSQIFQSNQEIWFVLDLSGYQVEMALQVIYQYIQKNEKTMLHSPNRIRIMTCRDILFYGKTKEYDYSF